MVRNNLLKKLFVNISIIYAVLIYYKYLTIKTIYTKATESSIMFRRVGKPKLENFYVLS